MRPCNCAVNEGAPVALPVCGGDAVPDTDDVARRLLGVPARVAQPAASGPLGSHTSTASGSSAASPSAEIRMPARSGQPALARATTATITTIAQPPVSASIQPSLTSLPVPNPWSNATGHDA